MVGWLVDRRPGAGGIIHRSAALWVCSLITVRSQPTHASSLCLTVRRKQQVESRTRTRWFVYGSAGEKCERCVVCGLFFCSARADGILCMLQLSRVYPLAVMCAFAPALVGAELPR